MEIMSEKPTAVNPVVRAFRDRVHDVWLDVFEPLLSRDGWRDQIVREVLSRLPVKDEPAEMVRDLLMFAEDDEVTAIYYLVVATMEPRLN